MPVLGQLGCGRFFLGVVEKFDVTIFCEFVVLGVVDFVGWAWSKSLCIINFRSRIFFVWIVDVLWEVGWGSIC